MADEYTESAFDILKKTLAYFGLQNDALNSEIEKLWRGKSIGPNSTVDEIGIQLKDTQAFKDRFPANALLAAANKTQYSVSQYLRQEADYKSRLTAAGLPPGFYDDPKDFQNWIANDVSPDEIQARIDVGFQAVKNSSPQVVEQFKRLYGVSEGDLAAYFIDPERAKPTFDKYQAQREARAAVVANQAQQQANIALTAQQSEELVRAGVTSQEAAQVGFMDIQNQQGLFQVGMQGETAISQEEQIAGTFGTNAEARQAIARRKRSRQAGFETGGGFASRQSEQTGLTTIGQ